MAIVITDKRDPNSILDTRPPDVSPGEGKISLRSLFGLLTAGGLVAGLFMWLELVPLWTIVFEMYVVLSWWHLVQLRKKRSAQPCSDQAELRAEVREWLRSRQ